MAGNLFDVRTQLDGDWRRLNGRWHNAKGEWNDLVRTYFELRYRPPLEQHTKATILELDRLGSVIDGARRHVK